MKLLIVVPGFGAPRVEFKQQLLEKNLKRIRATFTGTIDIKVFNYGTTSCNQKEVDEIMGPGIIGQFLYSHVTPNIVNNYDYVLLMLDDIELTDTVVFDRMIMNYEKYNFDILSPSLKAGSHYSHEYMLQRDTNKIRITQCLEFFFYLMRPSSYAKWYGLLDEKSTWLWGIDYALYNYDIRPGLMDTMTIIHHIKGGSHSSTLPVPMDELNYNRKRLRLQAQVKEYEYVDMV